MRRNGGERVSTDRAHMAAIGRKGDVTGSRIEARASEHRAE